MVFEEKIDSLYFVERVFLKYFSVYVGMRKSQDITLRNI